MSTVLINEKVKTHKTPTKQMEENESLDIYNIVFFFIPEVYVSDSVKRAIYGIRYQYSNTCFVSVGQTGTEEFFIM